MNISSLAQLADRLLNGDYKVASSLSGATPARRPPERVQDSDGGDRFTPSANASAAGQSQGLTSLQFERVNFSTFNFTGRPAAGAVTTTIPADVPSTANAASPASGAVSHPAPAEPLAKPALTPQAAAQGIPPVCTSQVGTSVSAPATTAGAPLITTPGTTAASTQDPLRKVNALLVALGLSPTEIQAFDQIAKLIQQFSPAASQDLLNQLQAFATQFAAENASSASGANGTSSVNSSANNNNRR